MLHPEVLSEVRGGVRFGNERRQRQIVEVSGRLPFLRRIQFRGFSESIASKRRLVCAPLRNDATSYSLELRQGVLAMCPHHLLRALL